MAASLVEWSPWSSIFETETFRTEITTSAARLALSAKPSPRENNSGKEGARGGDEERERPKEITQTTHNLDNH